MRILLIGSNKIFNVGLQRCLEENVLNEVIGCIENGPNLTSIELWNYFQRADLVLIDSQQFSLFKKAFFEEATKQLFQNKVVKFCICKKAFSQFEEQQSIEELPTKELCLPAGGGIGCFMDALDHIVNKGIGFSSKMCPELKSFRSETVQELSPREVEVCELLSHGLKNKQISKTLSISVRTVENHRSRIMKKVKAKSTGDLVRLYLSQRG